MRPSLHSSLFSAAIAAYLCSVSGCDSKPDLNTTKPATRSVEDSQWGHYGGSLSGTREAANSLITPDNAALLEPAWAYRTGDAPAEIHGKVSSFKATPILAAGNLVFSTGLNTVHAITPHSGELVWKFDPVLDLDIKYAEQFTSRGVSAWSDPTLAADEPCAERIYIGTLDARLISIDASTGETCAMFGDDGSLDLSSGANTGLFDWRFRKGEYAVTSPPLIANGVIVVGSSIGDNGKTNLESGLVRGFDARTGVELWRWDPIPRNSSPHNETQARTSWEDNSWQTTGAANVWSTMTADIELNAVYLPTTSPSPDFYGGKRLGDNKHANSVVALDLTTGQKLWAYQTIKHDLWDYDLAAQPMLVDAFIKGQRRSLLVQAGKNGFIYVVDRSTGETVYEVTEQDVPQTTVPGEQTSPTQSFPKLRLHPEPATMPPLFNASAQHVETCQQMLEGVEFNGVFTPPSLAGTLLYPGNAGGVNWGSMASLEGESLAFVVVNRWPTVVQLLRRADYKGLSQTGTSRGVSAEYTEQTGTPYGMVRFDVFNRETSVPCFEGPWSTLVAIDVASGTKRWEVPAGQLTRFAEHPQAAQWGSPVNQGGPITTDTGVVFLATRFDAKLRAFDAQSGAVLWSGELPAQPHATPMSYTLNGESYVVVTAGGWDTKEKDKRGDYVIAFKVASTEG